MPWTPLEACTFGAHLENRSVFILDLRLKSMSFKTSQNKQKIQISLQKAEKQNNSIM